jgi:hypothetical protein
MNFHAAIPAHCLLLMLSWQKVAVINMLMNYRQPGNAGSAVHG